MTAIPAQTPLSHPPERRVLLVDDDPSVLHALRRSLRRSGSVVEIADSGEAALKRLEDFRPQVVVSDYKMQGMNGVEFLRAVKERCPHAQRIMLTGYADQHAIEEAINRSEVFRFLSKPWDDGQLQLTIASAFEQHDLTEHNRELLALTMRQNEELQALAHSLEQKVQQRTEMLARAKDEWERTFDAIDRPIAVMEPDCTVVRANQAFAAMAGLSVTQVPGRRCHELLFKLPERAEGCPCQSAARANGEPVEIRDGGRVIQLSVFEGQDARHVCILHDVTRERLMTERAMQTEKLAAVGQLAGGVAHEINNPLGGILAFTQLMLREPGRSESDLEILKDLEHAAQRCKRIVENLLKFGRRTSGERALCEVNRPCEDAAMLFSAQLKSKPRVTLAQRLAEGLPKVLADSMELEQIILNLLVNALQALKKGEGTVTLETRAVDDTVEISVTDDGTGIQPEHLPHLFEPTFTTKPPGEGTGLGLSIAWGIAQNHGGRIDVKSEVGRGSTFTLVLPVAPVAA